MRATARDYPTEHRQVDVLLRPGRPLVSGAVLPRHEEELSGSGHQAMRAQHGARLRARVQPLHGGSALGLDDREGPGFKPPEITEIK